MAKTNGSMASLERWSCMLGRINVTFIAICLFVVVIDLLVHEASSIELQTIRLTSGVDILSMKRARGLGSESALKSDDYGSGGVLMNDILALRRALFGSR